jgi:hypothetical protein
VPYITKIARRVIGWQAGLDDFLEGLDRTKDENLGLAVSDVTQDIGNLNYIITRICLYWLGKSPRYRDYNAVVGALECAKLELYRRQLAAYEDEKIAINGEVETDSLP